MTSVKGAGNPSVAEAADRVRRVTRITEPTPRNASLPRNQSLFRGAELLRALANRPQGASVAELSRSVDLPRTTVTRLLATLAEIGFAERSGSRWLIGRELMRLGRAADPFRRLIDVSRP